MGGDITLGDGVAGVRWWRPGSLPEVEVVEAEHTSLLFKMFHESYAFALMLEGTVAVRYRRRIHDQRPGDVLLIEPGETHAVLHSDGPVSACIVLVDGSLVSRVAVERCGRVGEVRWRRVPFAPPPLGEKLRAVVDELTTGSPAERASIVWQFLADCIADHAEPPGRTANLAPLDEALARARDLLHARSSENVPLDELASAAQCPTKHALIRAFRSAFGFTPHQYLTHLRLQRARDLLKHGHDCGETAHAVGFYDQSQMNRHFIKHLGVTPGAYAKAVL